MQRCSPYFTPYSSSTSSQGYCNICYNQYDLEENKPLLICSQDHSICRECLKAIRRNLRCPFCRETIRLNSIRLNKPALDFIASKLNQHHNGKKKFLSITQNERLNTDYTVDIAELLDPHEESQAEEIQEMESTALKILIFLQLFLLQLPIGIYPFYLGMFSAQNPCMDRKMVNISIDLRDLFLVQGYVKCLVGFLTGYFTAFYNVQLMSWQGLMAFYLLLLAVIEMKSVICACIYNQIIKEGILSACDETVRNYSMLDLAINCFEFVLGLYLIIKYFHTIREAR